MVEESAQASQQMSDKAQDLAKLVDYFTVESNVVSTPSSIRAA